MDYWNGLLECTPGMDSWTDLFLHYNKVPLPVNLYPAFDQSVMVSISLHRAPYFMLKDEDMLLLHTVSFVTKEKAACFQLV